MTKEKPVRRERPPKTPLNWLGVFFAFVATMLVVTVAGYIVAFVMPSNRYALPITLLAALFAGIGTALYVKERGAMHAFIGGLIAIPFLALISFGGAWQPAIIAGALCGMGGAIGDLLRRRA